VKKHIL